MLKTLLDLAWEVPDDLINGQYINLYGEKCAVGWMLEQAGLSDEEIEGLDDSIGDVDIFQKVGEIYSLTEEQVESIIRANDYIDNQFDENHNNISLGERQLAVRRKLLELAGAGVVI